MIRLGDNGQQQQQDECSEDLIADYYYRRRYPSAVLLSVFPPSDRPVAFCEAGLHHAAAHDCLAFP